MSSFSNDMVVNIANRTKTSGTVLNDLKLLQLIQRYPFLFISSAAQHNDEDYENWAWEKITKQFNDSYKVENMFTTEELKSRWYDLEPIVACLNNMENVGEIPNELKHIVGKIHHLQRAEKNKNVRLPSIAESILVDNIEMVNTLTIDERLKLETEVMDLILQAELDTKAKKQLNANDLKLIDNECKEFAHKMGIQLPPSKKTNNNNINDNKNSNELEVKSPIIENKSKVRSVSPQSQRQTRSKKQIKMEYKTHIPLNEVHNYTRPFHIRLIRCNTDENIPLSKLKTKNCS